MNDPNAIEQPFFVGLDVRDFNIDVRSAPPANIINFKDFPTSDGAAWEMQVNPALMANPDLIAAAEEADAAAGEEANTGDNRNALAMAALENGAYALRLFNEDGQDGPNGSDTYLFVDPRGFNWVGHPQEEGFRPGPSDTPVVFHDEWADQVRSIGDKSSRAERDVERTSVRKDQSFNLRESFSGVNTDEELADLVRFQSGYQASAKIITTADEMLQTILDLKR